MGFRPLTPVLLLALVIAACGSDDESGDGPDATTAVTDAVVGADESPAGDAAPAPADDGRVRVIIDYSPTTSDVTALLYVSQHPAAELIAVTLAGTGESHCDPGVANTRALLELVDLPDVPVACGRDEPIGPGNEWPAEWREAADRLDGLDLTGMSTVPVGDDTDAAALLASTAADHGPVTIVALGPLTNLAAAIEARADLADHVAAIVTMGGAVEVEGNAPDGVAEWNYFIDPTAVDLVLRSGIPVTMVPLDATNEVPVTKAWFDALAGHRTTVAADVVHDLFAASRPYDNGFFFWDELAAATALDPTFVTWDEQPVVIAVGGPEQGRTSVDAGGSMVRIAIAADRERFERALLTVLNGGAARPLAPAATEDEIHYFSTVDVIVAEMSEAVDSLFATPLAQELATIEQRADSGALTPADDATIRAFLAEFWTGADGHLRAVRDHLGELQPPASVRVEHERYVASLDAVIATIDDRLADIATRRANELLATMWEPDDELEAVDAACEALGAVAARLGIDASTCP